MRSELWKSASGIAAAIFGLTLVVCAIRLGTDPELADTHRAAVAVAFTPAGVGVRPAVARSKWGSTPLLPRNWNEPSLSFWPTS